ncbi:MAG: hypothetical protein JWO33_2699 [Caulobacteraceae bacterium]|nr:hypothetical protein [Caulobacteraceae bacterium]
MPDAFIPSGAQDWIKDHVRRYLATDGEDGHIFLAPGNPAPMPALLLTTVGRRSGQKLILPLIYGRDGDNVVIVASRAGSPHHPSWFLNLIAQPQVEVQVLSDRFTARARVTEGEERHRLFAMMASILPNYIVYQEMTDRELPVIVLERLPG